MGKPNEVIDKDMLYGYFRKGNERKIDQRDKIYNTAVCQALDIYPEDDDMNVIVDRSKKGLGLKEIIAIGGLAAGISSVGPILDFLKTPEKPAVTKPVEYTDTDSWTGIDLGPPK